MLHVNMRVWYFMRARGEVRGGDRWRRIFVKGTEWPHRNMMEKALCFVSQPIYNQKKMLEMTTGLAPPLVTVAMLVRLSEHVIQCTLTMAKLSLKIRQKQVSRFLPATANFADYNYNCHFHGSSAEASCLNKLALASWVVPSGLDNMRNLQKVS